MPLLESNVILWRPLIVIMADHLWYQKVFKIIKGNGMDCIYFFAPNPFTTGGNKTTTKSINSHI
jgi:hypothetical protein